MKLITLLLGILLISPSVYAENERPEVKEGNIPQGTITIRAGEDTTMHEYRTPGGQVYKVMIIPKKGRPYFLVDSDGNGSLDLVQWILHSW
ncbi:MAG: DUF2782 domain-containing protein [Gammaproteobacteria bacterium]|nr:DUF2782 domain-containing protein [Gammaproteobacteria bacterium]